MLLPAWLEDEIARPRLQHLVTELHTDAPLEDVGVLVFVAMRVQRGAQGPRGQGVLDETEGSSGRLALDHESHSQGEEVHALAVLAPQYLSHRRLHQASFGSILVLHCV